MKNRTIAALLGATLALCGCATLPSTPTTRGLEISQVVDAIQCELASVYYRAPEISKEMEQFTSKVELELRILNSTSATAEAAVLVPITAGTATITPSGSFESSAGRISNLKFLVSMKALRKHHCATDDLAVFPTTIAQAQSNLGLTDWLLASLTAIERKDQADLDTMSYAIEFIVSPKANGALGLELVNWTPKLAAGAGIKDTQTLNISFARNDGPPRPTSVKIVSWPAGVRTPVLAPDAASESNQSISGTAVNGGAERGKAKSRRVPLNAGTEYKLDRELLQNRLPTIFGIPRTPIGF
jgi:hypothetical protein